MKEAGVAKKGNRKEEGLMMRMNWEASPGTLGATVYCSAMGSQWMTYGLKGLSDCFVEK